MVVALALCLAVSIMVNIAMGFLWADDKVMIKQLGEHNRELADKINQHYDDTVRYDRKVTSLIDRLDKIRLTLEGVSISKRDERGRFCGRVTSEQIMRGQL